MTVPSWRRMVRYSIILSRLNWFANSFSVRVEQHHQATLSTALRGYHVADNSSRRSIQKYLVVGDGDLSYSAQQAQRLDQNQVQLIASVLEDQETHHSVYKNSQQHTATIAGSAGHSVLFGVDATQLQSRFPSQEFDRVIFNFPHWRGKANNRYNRQLLDAFLKSASCVLKSDGEIHVALCRGQGGTESKTVEEWRQSWTASLFAAEHGLLLRRLDRFEEDYDRSSHRGVDRPFFIGDDPLLYIFSFANGHAVDPELQVSCRHELRLRLDPEDLAACPFSRQELEEGDVVPALVKDLEDEFPGVRIEAPLRDTVITEKSRNPILVFLVVHSGEATPLTRAHADAIRARLEIKAKERLGLQIAKPGRLVSKPFPYPLLDTLVEEFLERNGYSARS